MKISANEKWLLLGASRGLGFSFLKVVRDSSPAICPLVCSRKPQIITPDFPDVEFISQDYSRKENWQEVVDKLASQQAHRIFYFAGGGPFGFFGEKDWQDHEWAMRVTFEFPAFLSHQILKFKNVWSNLGQIVFIGSSVAENAADPKALSYSLSKHALKALVINLQTELGLQKNELDVRLFSPSYMDTGLLPHNAWPRQQSGKVLSPSLVANQLFKWVQNSDDANGHLSLDT